MNLVSIPVYTYLNNDSTGYRTDQVLLCSSSFIQRMIDTYDLGDLPREVYSYTGNPITTSIFPMINQFFGDTLIPINLLPYHAGFKSNCLNDIFNDLWADYKMFCNLLGVNMHYFQVDDNVPTTMSNQQLSVNRSFGLNGSPIYNLAVGWMNMSTTAGDPHPNIGKNFSASHSYTCHFNYTTDSDHWTGEIEGYIYPDGIFINSGLAPHIDPPEEEEWTYGLRYRITFKYVRGSLLDPDGFTEVKVLMSKEADYCYSDLYNNYKDFNGIGSGMQIQNDDPDNPMDDDGLSKPEGGDGGGGGGWVDNIDSPGIPALPPINVCDLGFITMYNPSSGQLKSIANFLWSSTFDLNTFKKLYGDPMDAIIGISIVPVTPSIGGARNVQLGNVDTGVNVNFLSSNWVEVNCGWVSIDKYIGTFLDASPFTKPQIYLPFIGFRSLNADEIVGGSIHVVYHVDVLSGACTAFIEHSTRGVLYTYNGSCSTSVPVTSIDFTNGLRNYYTLLGNVATTAIGALGGGAGAALGGSGLLSSAANAVFNSKPDVQRAGNMGGATGIMGILTPYVIIERPKLSMPSNMNNLIGNTSNMTYSLGVLRGFTMVEYIHIEGCSGTSEEVAEIESLLKQGVYL